MRDADLILGSKTYRLSAATILSTALARELGTVLFTHDRKLIAQCPQGLVRHPSDV